MTPIEQELLIAFELHSAEKIQTILDSGFDPCALINGKAAVTHLTEMYLRSDSFPECMRLMLDRGAVLDDPVLAPVLLDDADALRAAIKADSSLIEHRTTMASTFTPLTGASLLHVAAEYGNLNAARVLLESGAEVDARASVDEFGLNGHTPLFHTVNSNRNRSASVMKLLIKAGACCDISLRGITWGKGFEWETTVFDVTPVSYAQMGLLPQFQRSEGDIYDNIKVLLEASGRKVPPLENIPNRYLKPNAEG